MQIARNPSQGVISDRDTHRTFPRHRKNAMSPLRMRNDQFSYAIKFKGRGWKSEAGGKVGGGKRARVCG